MVDELLDQERSSADLDPILPEIIRALEHGLQEARAYFDLKPVGFDSAAFSVLVRLHARDFLKRKSLDAIDIEMEKVNLCGLWIKLGKYQVKIWKIGFDDLKKGLQSEAYGKAQMEIVQDGEPIRGFGLAVFWTADELRHLDRVFLVHQLRDEPRCFEWIWKVEVPHPAESITATPQHAGDIQVEPAVMEKRNTNE